MDGRQLNHAKTLVYIYSYRFYTRERPRESSEQDKRVAERTIENQAEAENWFSQIAKCNSCNGHKKRIKNPKRINILP